MTRKRAFWWTNGIACGVGVILLGFALHIRALMGGAAGLGIGFLIVCFWSLVYNAAINWNEPD